MAQGIRRRLALLAIVAPVYFLAGKFGLQLAFTNPSATTVWPPAGIALFALLVFGYGLWPAIFVAAFLVNITTSHSVISSLSIATGNTLEGLLGTYLVIKFASGRKAFEHYQSLLKFAFWAAAVSTAVSATVGVSTLCLEGLAPWSQYKSIWLTWWFGDAGGIIIVAPLLILWSMKLQLPRTRAQVLERLMMLLCLLIAGGISFIVLPDLHYQLAFLGFPVLAWGAFRFAQYETATGIALFSGLEILATLHRLGQFGLDPPKTSLVVLEAFLCTLALTTLTISALVLERRKNEETLQKAHDELEKRVVERTAELSLANESLQELSGRLVEARDLERRRLAIELHEGIAQILAALKLSLVTTQRKMGTRNLDVTEAFDGPLELSDRALKDVRTLAYLLYPPPIDHAGVVALIPSYAEGFEQRSGIKLEVNVPDHVERFPRDVEIALFHVLQESLTNIHCHSKSLTAQIRLEASAGTITLEIRDQGKGISESDLKQKEKQGVGLRGVRQLVGLLGGRLEIMPGNPGTIVKTSLPISQSS
jgi:signal transduction histidine kinase